MPDYALPRGPRRGQRPVTAEERELRERHNVCPHCPHLTFHNGDPCPSKEAEK